MAPKSNRCPVCRLPKRGWKAPFRREILKKLALTGAAAALLALTPVAAVAQSVEEMQSYCQPVTNAKVRSDGLISINPRTFESGQCWGAFGALQLATHYVDENRQHILHICPPPESTLTQLTHIFARYAEAHPEGLHEDFLSVALDALKAAFPC